MSPFLDPIDRSATPARQQLQSRLSPRPQANNVDKQNLNEIAHGKDAKSLAKEKIAVKEDTVVSSEASKDSPVKKREIKPPRASPWTKNDPGGLKSVKATVRSQAKPAAEAKPPDADAQLKTIVRNHANGVDVSKDLADLLSNVTPSKCRAMVNWLTESARNPYVLSTIIYDVRYHAPKGRKHCSLEGFIERYMRKNKSSVNSHLLYVKGWMSEFDEIDGIMYKSAWLRVRVNRFNLAKYFRQPDNVEETFQVDHLKKHSVFFQSVL